MREKRAKNRILRRALLALAACVAVCVLGLGILEGLVVAGSRTELKEEPTVMVILGAQVKPS
ncbi:MAG: hypothetical protein RRY53_00255, partial [Pseudoflavonifractor sp.]